MVAEVATLASVATPECPDPAQLVVADGMPDAFEAVRRVERFTNREKGGRGTLVLDDRPNGGELRQFDTATCVHCNRVVVLNQWRKRERGRCERCHAYICDDPICNTHCTPIGRALELKLDIGSVDRALTPYEKGLF